MNNTVFVRVIESFRCFLEDRQDLLRFKWRTEFLFFFDEFFQGRAVEPFHDDHGTKTRVVFPTVNRTDILVIQNTHCLNRAVNLLDYFFLMPDFRREKFESDVLIQR